LEQESVSHILIQWPLPIQTALHNYKLSILFIQWPVLIETAIHRFKLNIDIMVCTYWDSHTWLIVSFLTFIGTYSMNIIDYNNIEILYTNDGENEKQKYHTVRTTPKQNLKIVEWKNWGTTFSCNRKSNWELVMDVKITFSIAYSGAPHFRNTNVYERGHWPSISSFNPPPGDALITYVVWTLQMLSMPKTTTDLNRYDLIPILVYKYTDYIHCIQTFTCITLLL